MLLNQLAFWVIWAHAFRDDKICCLAILRKSSGPKFVEFICLFVVELEGGAREFWGYNRYKTNYLNRVIAWNVVTIVVVYNCKEITQRKEDSMNIVNFRITSFMGKLQWVVNLKWHSSDLCSCNILSRFFV